MRGRPARAPLSPAAVWLGAVGAALGGALAPTPWVQLGLIMAALALCAWWGRIGAAALRLGVGAALLFVGLRVGYRVLFASALPPPPSDHVLLALPTIPLSGPFSGIALLGPLTLEQLAATLSDASRFAVVFVVFGAANALVDARTLLARAPRRMLPFATVLSLALGTVPALLSAAQRVTTAARLRGERRGPHLLVPIFEQAVERATVLGASMELRGFSARSSPVETATADLGPEVQDPTVPVLRAEGLRVSVARHVGGEREILGGVDLTLFPGELTIVQGPTGSGKSTLLAALAGLIPSYTGGAISGCVVLADPQGGKPIHLLAPGTAPRPAAAAGCVALVPQRIEHSFVAENVRGELAYSLIRRGLGGADFDAQVTAALARFGLQHLDACELSTLSAGEATRVGIAAASLSNPRVLLLDEPVADLDPESVRAVEDLLAEQLAAGGSVLVAEHRPEALAALVRRVPTRWWELTAHGLVESAAFAAGGSGAQGSGAPAAPEPSPESGRAPRFVLAHDLTVERGGRALLRVSELSVCEGEIIVLSGPNGSGKTSLLEDLERANAAAALVPHRVDDLLIRDSVDAECRFADRRARVASGTTSARLRALIAAPAVPPAPGTHPRDASAGTRLALGIAVQLAHAPKVLLLDEPTRGLDRATRQRLAELCADLAVGGTALLLTTHDLEFARVLESVGARVRRLHVRQGRIV